MSNTLKSSCEGFLTMRPSPNGPPPMQRYYCVLIGTELYYYMTEDDAMHMLYLKGEVSVIGVQEWDGKGNVHIYYNGFLFATAQNKIFYAYTDTSTEKEKWIRAMQTTVETTVPHLSRTLSLNGLLFDQISSPTNLSTNINSNIDGNDQIACPLCIINAQLYNNNYVLSSNIIKNRDENNTNLTAVSLPNTPSGGNGSNNNDVLSVNNKVGSMSNMSTLIVAASQTPPVNLNQPNPPSSSIQSQIPLGIPKLKCYSCDGSFCERHVTKELPLPIKLFYYARPICDECYKAQQLINFLKSMVERLRAGICIPPTALDPNLPIELLIPIQRPSQTAASTIALDLFKEQSITAEELEQLLIADKRYLDNTSDTPEIPLDLAVLALHREFKNPNFTMYHTIIKLHTSLNKDPLIFKPIVEKILQLSYINIQEIEFYSPQLVHAYIRVPIFDFEKLFWLDELFISVSKRSINIALLLTWQLQAALEDSSNPQAQKDMEDKYPRILRLMILIEVEVIGKDIYSLLSSQSKNSQNYSEVQRQRRYPKTTDEQITYIESLMITLAHYCTPELVPALNNISIPDAQTRNLDRDRSLSQTKEKESITAKTLRANTVAVDEDIEERIDDTKPPPSPSRIHSQPTSPQHISVSSNKDSDIDERFGKPGTGSEDFIDFSEFQKHLLNLHDDIIINSEQATVNKNNNIDKDKEPTLGQVPSNDQYDVRKTNAVTQYSTRKTSTLSTVEHLILANYFYDERLLVEQITSIAEKLRFVQPVSERKKQLWSELEHFQLPKRAYIPLSKACDSFERIVRLPPNEASAFSTKARVPIMIIFEVIRGGANECGKDTLKSKDSDIPKVDQSSKIQQSQNKEVSGHIGQQHEKITEVNEMKQIDDSTTKIIDNTIEKIYEEDSTAKIKETENGTTEIKENKPKSNIEPISSITNEGVICKAPPTPTDTVSPVETPINALKLNGEEIFDNALSSSYGIACDDDDIDGDIVNNRNNENSNNDISACQSHDIIMSEESLEIEKTRRKDQEEAFGESWNSKKERIKNSSPYGHLPGWDIVSLIGKSNDDLRQEIFALQLIHIFSIIFQRGAKEDGDLPIWLKEYRIISTSSSAGLIETLTNSMSLDGLKKKEGYTTLLTHFEKSYGGIETVEFKEAQDNFINSMAGYSLICYFLQLKDRHNGNIMIDKEGHVIHIDYGFLLGIAPGGSFSIETAPFKLTSEMVETMGGINSSGFTRFANLCIKGFMICQKYYEEIIDFVEIVAPQSSFPCFLNKDTNYIISKLKSRFKPNLINPEEISIHVMSLIRKSNNNYSTRQYDNFQRMTNGILP